MAGRVDVACRLVVVPYPGSRRQATIVGTDQEGCAVRDPDRFPPRASYTATPDGAPSPRRPRRFLDAVLILAFFLVIWLASWLLLTPPILWIISEVGCSGASGESSATACGLASAVLGAILALIIGFVIAFVTTARRLR
jgi:hypothetical protein